MACCALFEVRTEFLNIIYASFGFKQQRAQGEGGREHGFSTRLPAPKTTRSKTFPEQEALGSAWNNVVRGDRVVRAHATPTPNLPLPAWTDGPSCKLPTRAVHVCLLVLRRRWLNLNRPVPSTLSRHPLLRVSHLSRE
jgi:hypothetical protein